MSKEWELIKNIYGCTTILMQEEEAKETKNAFKVIEKSLKALEIIKEKGFDKSIKDYDNYAIWVEYKTEQFDKAIENNPTILDWDVFDKIIYTQEQFNLLKEVLE